jgi:hypothetical protein
MAFLAMISTENSAVGSFMCIYIYIYHIVAVEVYCEISCVESSCHEIKKVLRSNLIDVIGKVVHCNADQSIGTALLCKNTCHVVWLSATNAHTLTNQNVM